LLTFLRLQIYLKLSKAAIFYQTNIRLGYLIFYKPFHLIAFDFVILAASYKNGKQLHLQA